MSDQIDLQIRHQVFPGHQRKGIARGLIENVIHRARKIGFDTVVLDTIRETAKLNHVGLTSPTNTVLEFPGWFHLGDHIQAFLGWQE